MTFLKQFISMSTGKRCGTKFKEFTSINTSKSKYYFITPNQASQQLP